MAVSADFKAYVQELFAGLGPVRFKPMFGVVGLYADELMFAIISDDTLYLRVDAQLQDRFRAAGSAPFVFTQPDGREIEIGYWRAPDDALEGPDEAEPWARLSLDAALRKQASKGRARRRRDPAGLDDGS